MIETTIKSTETGKTVKVSDIGELIVRSFNYSTPVFHSLVADNTADTWFKPRAGQRLVITDIIIQTDRNTAVAGTVIDIYEASSENSTTIDNSILQVDLERQATLPLTGLNFITAEEGKFINAKATDSNVLITISGFFVPA